MSILAIIKVARAIRRLVSAITPATDRGVAANYLREAQGLIVEALTVEHERRD